MCLQRTLMSVHRGSYPLWDQNFHVEVLVFSNAASRHLPTSSTVLRRLRTFGPGSWPLGPGSRGCSRTLSAWTGNGTKFAAKPRSSRTQCGAERRLSCTGVQEKRPHRAHNNTNSVLRTDAWRRLSTKPEPLARSRNQLATHPPSLALLPQRPDRLPPSFK